MPSNFFGHVGHRHDAVNNANDAAAQTRFGPSVPLSAAERAKRYNATHRYTDMTVGGQKVINAQGMRYFAKHPNAFARYVKKNP